MPDKTLSGLKAAYATEDHARLLRANAPEDDIKRNEQRIQQLENNQYSNNSAFLGGTWSARGYSRSTAEAQQSLRKLPRQGSLWVYAVIAVGVLLAIASFAIVASILAYLVTDLGGWYQEGDTTSFTTNMIVLVIFGSLFVMGGVLILAGMAFDAGSEDATSALLPTFLYVFGCVACASGVVWAIYMGIIFASCEDYAVCDGGEGTGNVTPEFETVFAFSIIMTIVICLVCCAGGTYISSRRNVLIYTQ